MKRLLYELKHLFRNAFFIILPVFVAYNLYQTYMQNLLIKENRIKLSIVEARQELYERDMLESQRWRTEHQKQADKAIQLISDRLSELKIILQGIENGR